MPRALLKVTNLGISTTKLTHQGLADTEAMPLTMPSRALVICDDITQPCLEKRPYSQEGDICGDPRIVPRAVLHPKPPGSHTHEDRNLKAPKAFGAPVGT